MLRAVVLASRVQLPHDDYALVLVAPVDVERDRSVGGPKNVLQNAGDGQSAHILVVDLLNYVVNREVLLRRAALCNFGHEEDLHSSCANSA